jgi:glyoxylase-like metal-dependent hydrolase (beta-lactamase superfamily II)/rhodanese-related sulfurtransferase
MYFRQFYLGCLAHASYLIGSKGEAAVVDPQRDIEQYVAAAEAQGLSIKYIIETHLHADFVSGYRELAEHTGAEIVFGSRSGATVPHRPVRQDDELRIGDVILRILETPGHTPESISILVRDTAAPDSPEKVLTGDTLFVGDVGRPDLVGSAGHSAEQMAGLLYDSLHTRLLKLPDDTEVFPAHGAGSMCGRNISSQLSSTIGSERETNYALRNINKEEFVRMMTTDLPEAPAYFAMDAEINRQGARPLDELAMPAALPAVDVHSLMKSGAMVLDVRDSAAYGSGHVPGSVNIGLNGQFASWVGSLVSPEKRVILVADDTENIRQAVIRMARVGLENVIGFLEGSIAAWERAGLDFSTTPQISVLELKTLIGEVHQKLQIVDVRRVPEYKSGHVPGAVSVPLAELEKSLSSLDSSKPSAIVCAGGYRSSAASSLLERQGFHDVYNVIGGTGAWINAGYEVET